MVEKIREAEHEKRNETMSNSEEWNQVKSSRERRWKANRKHEKKEIYLKKSKETPILPDHHRPSSCSNKHTLSWHFVLLSQLLLSSVPGFPSSLEVSFSLSFSLSDFDPPPVSLRCCSVFLLQLFFESVESNLRKPIPWSVILCAYVGSASAPHSLRPSLR